ncbi:MAG: SpoIIE family protein phosphatase [Phycisphaerales bacterium]|nr:SpoIIE family protein phosphatase [Phycisphaerales bacterium]
MAELIITTMHGRTRTHTLGDDAVVIGRDPGCEVPLDDLGASRRHATIRRENNSYVIKDLGSKNGTLVNDIAVPSATLRSGDSILIGSARLVFRDDSAITSMTSVVISEERPSVEPTTYHGPVQQADLSQRRLENLYELTDRLTRLRERDELLEDAMNVCFQMLRFERGAIAVRRGTGSMVDWPVVRNLRGSEGELKVSRTILGSALTHGERVIVNDTADGPIDPTVSMVQNSIRSAMCVPLLSGERNLGVIYGDRVSSGTTYSKEDIDFLAGIARLVTTGLINAQLLEEQKLKLQLENEMAMARQIQTGLFPPKLPERADVQAHAINSPGYHVSGDYYDFLELPEGKLAFIIADVTGEGVAASLLMANLQAAVRMTLPTGRPLASLMNDWNMLISRNTDASRFITCLVGIIDPTTRTLELSVAGHHAPQILRAGKPVETLIVDPDYPLGVIDDAEYRVANYPLGDEPCTLVAYTDGVIEAANESEALYSTERVVQFFGDATDLLPKSVAESLNKDVKRFGGSLPQGDDITIIAVHLA